MTTTISPQVQNTTSAVAPQPATPIKEPTLKNNGQPNTHGESPAAPTTEATPKPAENPQLAQFARKEKALRQQMRELKARETAYESKVQAAVQQKEQELRSEFNKDPLNTMLRYGVTYDQLVANIVNQPGEKDQTLQKLQDQIAELKISQEQQLTAAQQQQDQQYEQAKKQLKAESVELVNRRPDDFEMIKYNDSHDVVVALIEETFKKDGYVMAIEDAAKEVEDYLLDEYAAAAKLKKVQAKLAPKEEPAPAQKGAPVQKPIVAPAQTLTNQITQFSSRSSTDADRRARAVAAFKGQRST